MIGAAKAGTTSLHSYLLAHPDVRAASRKEVHFFDVRYERGPDWYRAQFPMARGPRRRWITGDASPYYLQHPLAPARAHALVPEARLVVLLRDPVERAFSHYRHERRFGETRSFAEMIEEERRVYADVEARLLAGRAEAVGEHRRTGLVARGRYAEQLERWLACYPRESLLVLDSDELFDRPAEAYERALAFLGLRPHSGVRFEAHNRGRPDDLDQGIREELTEHYREPNRRLYELLGTDFGWPA
ncbi:MAG: sulfotransferase [Acidimicrobiia bacterium]|nr:sulfotransferase [Acidimicrobiia bacterium]